MMLIEEVKYEDLPSEIRDAAERSAPPDQTYEYRPEDEARVWFYKALDGTRYTKLVTYSASIRRDTYYLEGHIPAVDCGEWLAYML